MELKGDFDLNSVRELNMTNLNRIQKLKNRASYRRDKHKGSVDREFGGNLNRLHSHLPSVLLLSTQYHTPFFHLHP